MDFARAFNGCSVYRGGPCGADAKGLCVHGNGALEGAQELAPGLALYVSSAESALAAVEKGVASAADFRLFVGHHEGLSTHNGDWVAVACARPLVLKQCR